MLGKIVTQIGAIGIYGCSKLLQGKVVLQIELLGLAVYSQQLLDIDGCELAHGCRLIRLTSIRNLVVKFLQRFDAPEQEADDDKRFYLCQILSYHLSWICEIDLINDK